MENRDQIARDIAQQALAAIQQHEAVCEERAELASVHRINMTEVMQRMESGGRVYTKMMEKQIEGLYSRFWRVAVTVIGGLFTIIIMLVSIVVSGRLH